MDANMVLLTLQDKIPSESLPLLQDKLKNANESQLERVAIVPLKNPIIGLILGILFGGLGIDRFYQGNIILGVAKLITLIIGFLTIWVFIGGFILFILAIWCIVDYFLVWKSIKKDNFNKILMQLQ